MGWTAPDGIIRAKLVVMIRNQQRGPSTAKISVIGIDLAKNVFQIHGIDAAGKAVLRRQLRRGQMERFFAKLPPTVVGMEAWRITGPACFKNLGTKFESCNRPVANLVSGDHHVLTPETSPSALQTKSMIAATKHRIFEMTFNASGNGSAGNPNPNAAQTANITNITATV
jgi:hypothetical protein